MSLREIFNTFSARSEITGRRKKLTREFRHRVIMLCAEKHYIHSAFNSPPQFWAEVHRKLTFLMGTPVLSHEHPSTHFQDIEEFLHTCSDDNFLDFVEFVFQTQTARPADFNASDYVSPADINTLFDISELPYQVTEYIFHTNRRNGGFSRHLVAKPKVIVRDSEVLHQTAIEPTLELFRDQQQWQSPNEEFGKALQHYRKNEFGDCVVMCGSSLESVMKIICRKKGWANKPDSLDAGKLLDAIVSNSNLDPYYKKLLELTHVIRNTKSPAHGAGTQSRVVPQHIALFVLNMTASTILLLAEETKPFF